MRTEMLCPRQMIKALLYCRKLNMWPNINDLHVILYVSLLPIIRTVNYLMDAFYVADDTVGVLIVAIVATLTEEAPSTTVLGEWLLELYVGRHGLLMWHVNLGGQLHEAQSELVAARQSQAFVCLDEQLSSVAHLVDHALL